MLIYYFVWCSGRPVGKYELLIFNNINWLQQSVILERIELIIFSIFLILYFEFKNYFHYTKMLGT